MKYDNHNHPELLPGEAFRVNMTCEQFRKSKIAKKRIGNIAYYVSGEVVEGYYPVFGDIQTWKKKRI